MENPQFMDFFREWFYNDINSELNARKNFLAIQSLCAQAGVPYYLINTELALERPDQYIDQAARDLMHPGAESQKKFAQLARDLIKQNPQGVLHGYPRISNR